MLKICLLLIKLFWGLFNQSSFSQDLNMLKNAPFVFKGRVLGKLPFKNENCIWMEAYQIVVKTIYKGDGLKLDTINLIAESVLGWSEDGVENMVSEYTPEEKNKFALGYGGTYLFFCNQYDGYLPDSTRAWGQMYAIKNKSIILEPICNTRECFFNILPYPYFYKDENNKIIGPIKVMGCGKSFKSEEEFMEYLIKEGIISSDIIIKKKRYKLIR